MKRILFSLFIFVLAACSTTPNTDILEGKKPSSSSHDYESVLDSWTRKGEDYNNFEASFQVTAVLLSRELTEEQIKLDATRFNWSDEETQTARQKALDELQKETTFMVSLYTGRDEDNNLDKSNPAWNLYLNVHGKRTTPQLVKRVYENRVGFMQKYPGSNVWTRNYYVKFPVPSDDASAGGAELAISGPLGNAHLKY